MMKNRITLLLAMAVGLMTVAEARAGEPKYVGSKACKKCHLKQYKSWEKGKQAQGLEALKPGQATEIKAKFNLDPDKDYTQDKSCLSCHTVGFGKEGGYFVPDPEDAKAVKKAAKLAGVGCECCHGPGSEYVKLFKEIQKSKRTYKPEELYAVGLTKIEESVCLGCHNEKSPTYDTSNPFNFEERKEKGAHEHVELKQRDG